MNVAEKSNLNIWTPTSIQHLAKWTRNTFLHSQIVDGCDSQGPHPYVDIPTVEEFEKPMGGSYISHDNHQSKDKPHPHQEAADAKTVDSRQQGDPRQEVDDNFSINLDYIDLSPQEYRR
jgi:hypothetical protein